MNNTAVEITVKTFILMWQTGIQNHTQWLTADIQSTEFGLHGNANVTIYSIQYLYLHTFLQNSFASPYSMSPFYPSVEDDSTVHCSSSYWIELDQEALLMARQHSVLPFIRFIHAQQLVVHCGLPPPKKKNNLM